MSIYIHAYIHTYIYIYVYLSTFSMQCKEPAMLASIIFYLQPFACVEKKSIHIFIYTYIYSSIEETKTCLK